MLNGSCAVSALLTLPAAVSVGVLLAGPVQATTTISGTNAGVSLSSYGTIDNPFTITSGTTVSATGNAIMGNDAGSWTLGNAGTVNGTDLGVLLQAGGSVTNDGSILGAMGR
jgi:hypothetical protein